MASDGGPRSRPGSLTAVPETRAIRPQPDTGLRPRSPSIAVPAERAVSAETAAGASPAFRTRPGPGPATETPAARPAPKPVAKPTPKPAAKPGTGLEPRTIPKPDLPGLKARPESPDTGLRARAPGVPRPKPDLGLPAVQGPSRDGRHGLKPAHQAGPSPGVRPGPGPIEKPGVVAHPGPRLVAPHAGVAYRAPAYRAPAPQYWSHFHRPAYWGGIWPYYHRCHWQVYRYRPWAWVTWPSVVAWFGYTAPPVYYGYYVADGYVYSGDERLATVASYSEQAAGIAGSAAAPGEDAEWLPLGVFALSPDEDSEPEVVVQLAAARNGAVAGTYYHAAKGVTLDVAGSIDKDSQRAAWRVGGEKGVVMETGLENLTKDRAPVLLHFPEGVTETWVMTRVSEEAARQAEGHLRVESTRRDLAAAWEFLQRSLGDDWKAYLAVPEEVTTGQGPPPAEALHKSLGRFEKTAADPQYEVVAALPGFHTTRKLLDEYVRALAAPQGAP